MFGLFDLNDSKKGQEDVVLSTLPTGGANTFTRFEGNPILAPESSISWKTKAVYNPAAIYLDRKVHLIYRGQASNGVSSFGYAQSHDGITISENLDEPIYRPSASFEMPTKEGWNSGCEDPRITRIDDRLYMTYTAYDGTNPPRVALTSISEVDFLARNWLWEVPKLISPPGLDDKDCCIVRNPNGKGFLAFHRLGNAMWMDSLRDLEFPEVKFLTGGILASAREDNWDNVKIGLAAPPIETSQGWLLLYHAVCNPGFIYKIGAMLLDKNDPHTILARSDEPLLSPEADYEKNGQVPNLVFSCGAVVIDGMIFLYYGGGDTVTCVATMQLESLLDILLKRYN